MNICWHQTDSQLNNASYMSKREDEIDFIALETKFTKKLDLFVQLEIMHANTFKFSLF